MKRIYLCIAPLILLAACGDDKAEEEAVGSYQITTDGRYVYRLNTATGDIDLFERGYRPMIKELPQAGSSKRYDDVGDKNKTSAYKTE